MEFLDIVRAMKLTLSGIVLTQPKPIEVQVISHQMQRYAVWFGGSMLASTVSVLSSYSFHCAVSSVGTATNNNILLLL